MNIDKAIEILNLFKQKGETDIIFAAWTAGSFDLSGEERWPELAEAVEKKIDWSSTGDYMWDLMCDEMTDEELAAAEKENE